MRVGIGSPAYFAGFPAAGIEFLQLAEGLIADATATAGRALERVVVDDHDDAVLRERDVAFGGDRALLHRETIGGERVLGGLLRSAAMGDDDRGATEPASLTGFSWAMVVRIATSTIGRRAMTFMVGLYPRRRRLCVTKEREFDVAGAYRDAEVAARYAEKHDRSAGHRARDSREQALWRSLLADVGRPDRILDCPAGTGRFWPLLAEIGGELHAVDGSDEMLSAGVRRHPEVALASVSCARAEALPFDDEHFDLVFSSRLLHHFDDAEIRRTILREFARVSCGRVAFSTWRSGNWPSFREQRLSRRADARTRFFRSMPEILADVAAAGLEVEALRHKQRLFSPLLALVCRKR